MSKINKTFFCQRAVASFFLVCCLFFPSFWKEVTRGFKIAKLYIDLPYNVQWEASPFLSQEEIDAIFSQSFCFLGKGAQCYAFVSQDDQYVLKLFRFDPRKRRKEQSDGFFRWASSFSSAPWTYKRAERFFSSCKIGYELAREETALLYLHLNATEDKLPSLSLKLPNRRSIRLPLDPCRFAIQKKGRLLEPVLFDALLEGSMNERLDALFSLLKKRCGKGIGNRDPNLWRNFGFVGDKAIEIDFGNYWLQPELAQEKPLQKELWRYAESLHAWLQIHAPEFENDFNERFGV